MKVKVKNNGQFAVQVGINFIILQGQEAEVTEEQFDGIYELVEVVAEEPKEPKETPNKGKTEKK